MKIIFCIKTRYAYSQKITSDIATSDIASKPDDILERCGLVYWDGFDAFSIECSRKSLNRIARKNAIELPPRRSERVAENIIYYLSHRCNLDKNDRPRSKCQYLIHLYANWVYVYQIVFISWYDKKNWDIKIVARIFDIFIIKSF